MALRASILKTLVYADIFDYPLTRQEIYHWSIGPSSLKTPIHHPKIKSLDSYYFLAGRQKIVSLRQARAHWSQQKLHLATKVGEWLKIIPTIKLVAVTGALAMSNSAVTDDIDLMIVTSPHTLWLTRPLVVLLLEISGLRRRPTRRYSLDARRFNDKICLNLWLDPTSLAVPPPKRNLYTAHEVAQVKPLWDRHHTYAHFLSANRWINKYLPNIPIPKIKISQLDARRYTLTAIFNHLAFRLQLWYMRPRLTRETVTLHSA